MADLINTSFSGGEASPSFWGRTDEARFKVSASVVRNCFVDFRGGIKSRGGTRFIGPTWYSLPAAPRIITFRFSIFEDYILVFGDSKMRVAYQGAYITKPTLNISGITQASVGVVTTTAPHGLSNGSLVFLNGIVGMTALNNNFFFAQNVASTTFELHSIQNANVSTASFPAYISGGTVAPIYEIASPYAAVDLPYLKFTQSADVMSICCVNTATLTEYPPYDLERFSDTNWSFVQTTFGVSISAPANLVSTASSLTPPTTVPPTLLTNYAYVVTAVNGTTGEESQASNVTYVASVDIAATAGSITLSWAPVSGAAYYNIYKAPASYNAVVPVGSQFGYAGSSFGTQFVDSNITQDFTTTPPLHLNPFARGQILGVTVTAPGSGLNQANVGFTITTGTGSGFAGFPIVVSGAFVAFYIQNPGRNYAPGDTIAITQNAAYASGFMTFTSNPLAGENIVLNGVTWGFVASGAGANQTNIQSTVQLTVAQLTADLQASVNGSISVANYTYSYLTLSIVYATTGVGGNAYTLGGGTVLATPSGLTLTGGANSAGSGGATATLTVGPQTGTYPSVVGYFQQRRVYAATLNNPDTYYMSRTGAYTNMDVSSPPVASDAITGSPWAQQVNGIQWLQPMPGGLIVGTGLDAWQLSGTTGAGSPISPAQQDAQPQESNGFSATLPPIKVNYDILYVQSLGTIVRDLEYNFFVNIYAGQDISLYSNHLFENYQIVQWGWAKEPYKIIWAVRNDGKLLSLSYVKEQKVFGWTRHDTNGAFVSVTTASEPPVDAPYFIVKRSINGGFVYYLERMDNRLWTSADSCWCLDSALSLTQTTPNATLAASSAMGNTTLVNPTVVTGGSNYTAPAVTIFDPTNPSVPPVSGSVTLTGGVITGFTIPSPAYTSETIKIVVTDATGTGAVLAAQVQNLALFTASAGVFDGSTIGAVGQAIRMDGGYAVVTQYVNSTSVYADIQNPINLTVPNDPSDTPVVATAGQWSITTPVTTLSGLMHLIGETVNVLADGNVVTDLTVSATGTVTLPFAASNIVLGLPFVAQLQALHTDIGGAGTVQGKSMRVSGVTVRMEKTRGLEIGANQPIASTYEYQQEVPWGQTVKMRQLQDRTTSMIYGQPIPLFTGDKYLPISDVWKVQLNQSTYGMVAAQQENPLPMGILAFIYSIDVGS